MKKLLFTIVLFVFAGSFLLAQDTIMIDVSGHVYDIANGTPLNEQEVTVVVEGGGMSFTYLFVTDIDGYYGDNIYPGTTQGSISALTIDCNNEMLTQEALFNPGNMSFIFDFEICIDEVPPGDCVANFEYETDSVPGGQVVWFWDTSEGFPTNWFWDFGDGEISYEQNPTHTYFEPDVFEVCLTISSNDSSCYDVYCQEIDLGGNIPDCENWFTYDDYGNEFVFYGEAFPEANEYIWDFGDGETGYGQVVDHYYGNSGEVFMVTLFTSSGNPGMNDYCEAYSTQEIFINGGISDCDNWFWYEYLSEFTVIFEGEVDLKKSASYIWDFGDGETGNGQFIEHTYAEEGSYVVMLETYLDDSCYSMSAQDVVIGGGGNNDCENWFWYDTYDNITFNFFGESYFIDADEYIWDFGDGNTAYGQEVEHTYDVEPGYYEVTLSTFGYNPAGDSCYAVSMQDVWVGEESSDCENWFWYEQINEVTFDFYGELFEPGVDAEYTWTFGDGAYGYGQEITHTFDPANGTEFEVCLTTVVYYNDSCSFTSCEMISIGGNIGDNLYGTIFLDENLTADYAVVGLFGIDEGGSFVYDMVLSEPLTGFYNFEDVPEGDYYLIASLVPGSEFFMEYFPTYYEDALFWWNADIISLGEPVNPYNVQLVPTGSLNGGPGTINGGISFPDRGDGLSNINIIIMDEDENPIQYVSSDADGYFAFESLEYGTYKLKVDIANVESEIATVELSENNQNVNVEFFFGGGQVYLGIDNNNATQFDLSSVYPNPVKSEANINLQVQNNTTVNVAVYNAVGQLMQTFNVDAVQGINLINVNTFDLSSGLYHIKITADTWIANKKFIK